MKNRFKTDKNSFTINTKEDAPICLVVPVDTIRAALNKVGEYPSSGSAMMTQVDFNGSPVEGFFSKLC